MTEKTSETWEKVAPGLYYDEAEKVAVYSYKDRYWTAYPKVTPDLEKTRKALNLTEAWAEWKKENRAK